MRSLRTPALLLRHATSGVSASILVAALVLIVTFVVAAAPRALVNLSTDELRHELDSLSVVTRDVTSTGNATMATAPGDVDLPDDLASLYGATEERLIEIGDDTPDPLRSVLGTPDYVGISPQLPANDSTKSGETTSVVLAFDPRAESRITMVEGSFPSTFDPDPDTDPDTDSPHLDIMLSPKAALEMKWEVGEERIVDSLSLRLRLTGLFEPADSTSDFWAHVPSLLDPAIDDNGNTPRTIVATAYVAPASAGPGQLGLDSASLNAWYPVDTAEIDISTARELQPQLRKFVSSVHQLPSSRGAGPEQPFNLDTATLDAMDRALARTTATSAVLGMAASGPLGVVLAVFALGARSVVDRRRAALTLAAARGGSQVQMRGAMALEGLVLGVIPGAIGIAIAAVLVPAPVGLDAVLAAVLLALAPAVLFGAAAQAGGIRATRSDLDPRVVGRVRRIAEILVVLLAAVALFLLVRRGLVTSVDSTGVDPLLAATPLLLSLAVCVGVLRLYPYPLLAVHKRLQRSRRLVGFIGSGRAVRDPSVGLAAALAIVVAVSVAVFSATLLTTLDDALQTTASTEVGGGDLSVSARYLLDDQVAAIAAVPGVDVSAGIDDQGTAALRAGSAGTNAELLTAETTGLSGIRNDIPAHLDTEIDGAIPIVISQDLADEFDGDADLVLQGEPVRVVAVLPNESGLGQNATWVLVDTTFIERLGDFAFAPQLVVIALTADADPADVAAAITEAVPIARATTIDDALAETHDSPTVSGLRLAFMLAILAVSLLAVLAVVLSSVIGTPARNRLLGSLRTLGLSTRQAGGLAAWELAPVVVTALVAGTLLGIALPLVVTATVDLSAFTGGLAVTAPHYEPLFLGAVLGIVAVATILAAAISVALSLRRTPASTVKIGAD